MGCAPKANSFYMGDMFKVGPHRSTPKTIPVMAGTVLDEFLGFMPTSNQAIERDTETVIAARFGEESAKRMIELFRQAYPGKSLRDLADLDGMFRLPTMRLHREVCRRGEGAGVLIYVRGGLYHRRGRRSLALLGDTLRVPQCGHHPPMPACRGRRSSRTRCAPPG